MTVTIRFTERAAKAAKPTKADVLVLPVAEGKALPAAHKALDKSLHGLLNAAYDVDRFTGKKGQTLSIIAPAGHGFGRVLLVGLGDAADLTAQGWQRAGGTALAALNGIGAKSAHVLIEETGKKITAASAAAQFAIGAGLRDYRFDKYLTKQKPEDKPTLTSITLDVVGATKAKADYQAQAGLVDAVHFTRDLVSEPGNIIYPATLAEACKELSPLGVQVEILTLAQLKKLGMGALLGVAQGSAFEPRVVVMRWNGGAKSAAPIALVGKGVTFDSGGISIKPSGGMEEMKWDMAGAGAVIGTMRALAARKAKTNAVGVVGLVENMPSHTAQRPGDIVTSMSGQTIEVLNTDAEGRLVLADVLWYTNERFKPKAIIDLATLTGAIIVAIGSVKAGLFANDDKLAAQLLEAGEAVGEPLWRMPLGDEYDRMIDSPVADMQNIGREREAGSTMGAVFLQRFVGKTPWAHLDIAGTAWSKKDTPLCPKGATAYGVRLLDTLIASHFEK